jgi:predicted small lipoprotein YifL
MVAFMLVLLGSLAGCHHAKPPDVTQADVDAAQQDAQHEVDQARVEAKKDIKSAAKIMGADSPDMVRARITGAFDIAMAHADGDHKIALEKCLLLDPSAQPACRTQADSDYQAAAASAKAIRVSQQARQ